MPIMLNLGKEILRISPKNSFEIESSTNGGRSWYHRYENRSSQGAFFDLALHGSEILATTEKGLFSSKNAGKSWYKRS
ncbi:hypothetical protein [Selenomonas sp.]|uniref:hypothetical protein n=1 Tax=Selenomonas sp. TaxID=2053611 RepID=UPI003FA285CE